MCVTTFANIYVFTCVCSCVWKHLFAPCILSVGLNIVSYIIVVEIGFHIGLGWDSEPKDKISVES